MRKPYRTTYFLLAALLVAAPVCADRRGPGVGVRPGGGDRIDGDRGEYGGGTVYYPPGPYYAEDREAVEAQREEERRREEAARNKARNSHADPSGGFFTDEQDPKTFFDE